MSFEACFWLVTDVILIALWIDQARELLAAPEEWNRLMASSYRLKEEDHAADQESP